MEYKAPISELLVWLKGKPRNMGWSCILAYDRTKTNVVLLQEYIERFTSDSFLPPITAMIATGDVQDEMIYDFILDAGRLSFENATIQNSKGRLTMRIIRGSQLNLASRPGGLPPEVTRVSSYDALGGPRLYMDLTLEDVAGSVDEVGRVVLDIAKAADFRLTFAKTERERKLGGDFFQELFDGLPAEKKILVLNQLKNDPEQLLQPETFYVRTHPAPGVREFEDLTQGSGEVLLFIQCAGGEEGTIPPSDAGMQYLIADGSSASVLLGHEFLAATVFSAGCRTIADPGSGYNDVLVGGEEGFLKELKVTGGSRKADVIKRSSEAFSLIQVQATYPLTGGENQLKCLFANDEVAVNWMGSAAMESKVTSSSSTSTKPLYVSWHIEQKFKVELDTAAGTVSMVPHTGLALNILKVTHRGSYSPDSEFNHKFSQIVGALEAPLLAQLQAMLVTFAEPARSIDILRLNSLLFRGENAVVLNEVYLPGDMFLSGDVGPTLTHFAIDPIESDIGPGQTRQLATVPPRSGVTWKIEPVAGFEGEIGKIDSITGVYTSPGKEALSGKFTRVKVTASAGAFQARALINVVTRDIAVNPMVFTCFAADADGREMSAGALGEGALTWKIADPTAGGTIVPSSAPLGDKTYLPGPVQAGKVVTVDEIVVQNSVTKSSQSSYALVIHTTPVLSLWYQDAGSGKVQLRASVQGQELPIDADFTWEVLAGSGTIHEKTGVFTPDLDGQYSFAVIYVTYAFVLNGYLILPVPLVDLPEALRLQTLSSRTAPN